MRYLLDTNAWIVYFKGRQTTIRARLEETPRDQIATCSVVWAELLHGARKYENPAERRDRVERVLDPLENFDFDRAAAQHYAIVRDTLEKTGMAIGLNDLLIASIALANDLTVVTNNTDEFNRVPGLRVEDWSA
jgi:tRNA(fMet)-specific endonuclease VapC